MLLVNINVGIKINNSNKIAAYIKKLSPDIVTFQEIVRHLDNNVFPEFKSLTEIANIAGVEYKHKFFGPLWTTDAFRINEKVIQSFGGFIEQGNAVWSKLPITNASNEHFYGTYTLALDWSNWEKIDHGRAIIVTELKDKKERPFQILNLHGIWTNDKLGDERTIKECEYVMSAAQRKNIPTIIVGDFNLLPNTDSVKLLDKHYRNLISEYKITTTRPDKELICDYVFVSQDVKVNSFSLPHTDVTDHLPMILDFELSS